MSATSRVLAVIALLGFATTASAAPLVFTVDQNLSQLQLQIGAGAPPEPAIITTPQFPGSDITSLFGTIDADYDGSSITFNGGANIQFALQPLDQAPLPGGQPGTAPAQYGMIIALPPVAQGPGAVRDAVAEATSGVVPITAGTFDGTLVSLGLTQGTTDVNLTGIFGVSDTLDIGGFAAANEALVGTITQVGNVVTFTLPLLIQVLVPADDTGLPLDLTAVFTGTITATAIVPEPGTVAMLGMGLVGLVAVGRRRIRKA